MGAMKSNTPKTFPIPGRKKQERIIITNIHRKLGIKIRTKMHEPKIPKAVWRTLMSLMEERLVFRLENWKFPRRLA